MYDNSNLNLNTHITALNKTVSRYGSFSYFQGKTPKEKLNLPNAEKLLKFLVEKNTLRNELKFQLTNISGNKPKIKDNKIHNFSITRLGRKRKLPMQEPIEAITIRAHTAKCYMQRIK